MKKTFVVETPDVHVSLPVRLPYGLTGAGYCIADVKKEQEARKSVA